MNKSTWNGCVISGNLFDSKKLSKIFSDLSKYVEKYKIKDIIIEQYKDKNDNIFRIRMSDKRNEELFDEKIIN